MNSFISEENEHKCEASPKQSIEVMNFVYHLRNQSHETWKCNGKEQYIQTYDHIRKNIAKAHTT